PGGAAPRPQPGAARTPPASPPAPASPGRETAASLASGAQPRMPTEPAPPRSAPGGGRREATRDWRRPGGPADSCGSLCGRSRLVNPPAAVDGGASRDTRRAELIGGRPRAGNPATLATPPGETTRGPAFPHHLL